MYFTVYKVSRMKEHKGMKLKPELPEDIRQRLIERGYEETETCFRIPLAEIINRDVQEAATY